MPVVFNLFFEVEPLVAILIAHGTHELSKECVVGTLPRPGGQKLKVESGRAPSQLGGLGELCKVTSGVRC